MHYDVDLVEFHHVVFEHVSYFMVSLGMGEGVRLCMHTMEVYTVSYLWKYFHHSNVGV